MDLYNPLAVVAPTLDAAVLQGLTATTSWTTGRGVHRMISVGSQDGVRKVLIRLAEQGIVDVDRQPHATLFRLNRDHVATDAIVTLSRLRQAIVDRIVSHLARWQKPPIHASLFGSFARNEADTDSDIDLLAVVDPSMGDDERAESVVSLSRSILRWTGNRGHVIDVAPMQLFLMIEADDPLVTSWRADAVRLLGTPLPELLRHVRVNEGRIT